MTNEVAIRTMPEGWSQEWSLSYEAVETLWERAATRILEHEDRGDMRPTMLAIWGELHQDHPELYPNSYPPGALRSWWGDPDWKRYLAVRRQEHYLRTMPTRIEITRYSNQLLQAAGTELVRRVYEDPASVPTKDLVAIMREATKALVDVDADIRVAQGQEEHGRPVSINVYQFLEQLPPDRRSIVAARIASENVGKLIEPPESKSRVLTKNA